MADQQKQTPQEIISEIQAQLTQLDQILFNSDNPENSADALAQISANFHKLANVNYMSDPVLKNKIIGVQAQMDTIIQKATKQSSENKSNMVNVLQRMKVQQSYGNK